MSEKIARRALIIILVLFLGLGSAYALTTPTLEAPDENYHYDYVRALVNTGRPPVLEEGGGRGFGHHAPLYYAYGALASFWVGDSDWIVWPERHNPFFGYEFGEVGRDNKNLYLHPDSDSFGESDTWLGIRVVRLASVLLGAGTIWVTFRTGREVFPKRPEMALAAAGLVAFIPEYLFISGAVNDDNGAALFGSLAIWAMVRMARKGVTWRRCAGLGVALGLGWLSKLTVVALLPTAALTLALIAWRDGAWQRTVQLGLITFGVAALLIGPWIVRQTVLYGDPTGTSREMSEWGLREDPVTLDDLGPDLYWLRTSFWGRLGYNQIPLSSWIYTVLDILTALAILGLGRLVVLRFQASGKPFASVVGDVTSTSRGSQFAILTSSFLLTFGPMIVRRFLRPMPNFGRYLFPVLPSIAVLTVWGLSAWLPPRRHVWVAMGLTGGMLALGISGVTCYLAPAFERPAVFIDTEAPTPDQEVNRIYSVEGAPLARLIGYQLNREAVEPGGCVRVSMTWEVLGETDTDYVLFAQLFGRDGEKVGQRDTYPGLGHYPTSFWEPGQTIVDEVPIPVSASAAAPSRLRLDVGLYQLGLGRLPAFDAHGRKLANATLGWLKLSANADPPLPTFSGDYRVGSVARLIGYDLEQTSEALRLALHWSCRSPTSQDYVVFVHLLDEHGELVAQADGPPVGGDYPTSLWETGERIVDHHLIDTNDVQSGAYDLRVGLYTLETGDRLPVHDRADRRIANDAIPLAEVDLP